MKIKKLLLIKFILIFAAFLSCGVAFLCGMGAIRYLDQYDLETKSYTDTSQFEQLYLKYAERTAVYVTYKENGFETDPGSIYSTSDLVSMLSGDARGNLRPSESVYTPSQESFEYYNRILNYDCKSFYYYVKNKTTGNYYYNPDFAKLIAEEINTEEINTVDLTDQDFENYLDNISSLPAYLIINTENDRYITNVNKSKHNVINDTSIAWITDFITSNSTMTEDDFVIYTFVLDPQSNEKDEFSTLRDNYTALRNSFDLHLRNIAIASICFLLTLIGLSTCSGHKKGVDGIYLNAFDKLYSELGFGLTCGGFAVSIFFVYYANDMKIDSLYYKILLSIAFVIAFIFGVLGLTSLVKRIKARTLIKHSILYKLFQYLIVRSIHKIKQFVLRLPSLFINQHAAFRLLFILGVFGLLQGIAFLYTYYSPLIYMGFVILIFCFLALTLIKTFADMNSLILGTRKIADGDLTVKIQSSTLSEPSRTIACDINRIGDGLSNAVDARLKSERLKTELITNVSHDIKTPLTSIINYVDLLNKENLENETANGYLKILTEKSWRLKTLIEDLVEASKASTGTLSLTLERLNIVELTKQALGEFDDRFVNNHLETILNIKNEQIHILGDGRSTYRIIENLFSNVNKYALPNTRVYVDVTSDDNNAIIQIKNISANQLGINGEELMERFVRGDLSRNSEGSGLGLSIAKSLATLQHGNFDVILDGDLFKAIVTLPLYKMDVES